jgi:L-alanine-DL-glutamate epimerase-like enolase superfamily enzyme
MLGGKFRDRILLYADTISSPDPDQMAKALQNRIAQGYKFLKMDLAIAQIGGRGNVVMPAPGRRTSSPAAMSRKEG